MSENVLKERSELDARYKWDLSSMFADDAAWETAFTALDADIDTVAAFAGKLHDADTLKAYLDAQLGANWGSSQYFPPLSLPRLLPTPRRPYLLISKT